MSCPGVQGLELLPPSSLEGTPAATMASSEPSSDLSSGYKMVPWSSWDQWNFVRESIFSSSPDSIAAALRRISAWRSRGCIPVQIDVTAAIIETQQKDPFFREGPVADHLSSEEMLAMLYCMAVIRLVNGFVEPMHKKTGRSISELAAAAGIPRMLVDIRHESSHRELPSIRLARLASMKALDWLKSNYWEPQRNSIPDVRREIRSRLREMTYYLKTRNAQKLRSTQSKGVKQPVLLRCHKLSSQIIGKLQSSKSDGSERQISRIYKVVARLYSVYPAEVVSALLEYFHLQIHDFSDLVDTEHFDSLNEGDPGPFRGPINYLKTIVTKLSAKKPSLLVSLLDAVLDMIEVKESKMSERSELYFPSSQHQAETWDMKYLSSLAPWLILNLKAFKDSGQVQLVDETQILCTDKNAMPKASVTKILRRCLKLSILGDKHLTDSVILLAEMIGNSSLSMKLKKLPLPCWEDWDSSETHVHTKSMLLKEEDFVKKAAEKLELLKLHLKNRKRKASVSKDSNVEETSSIWTVARNWIPCPIGMVPCSLSSTAVLPALDKACDKLEIKKIDERQDDTEVNTDVDTASGMKEEACDVESAENGSATKRLKLTQEDQQSDSPETLFPMKGRLLIDGVYKRVTEEELLDLESNIRLFVQYNQGLVQNVDIDVGIKP